MQNTEIFIRRIYRRILMQAFASKGSSKSSDLGTGTGVLPDTSILMAQNLPGWTF